MDKRTALIMIDMQRAYLEAESPVCIPGAKETVPACAELIRACRERGIPVVFVARCYRDDGSDVEHPRVEGWLKAGRPVSVSAQGILSGQFPEEFGVKPDDYIVVKPRFSAFFGTELDTLLRRLGVDSLLMAGTTTPNCIRTTAFDAIALEYNVAVAGDCTDESVIRKVESVNQDYILREQGAVLNWFDIIEKEGYYSLNDTLGDIMKSFRGKFWFVKLFMALAKKQVHLAVMRITKVKHT